MYPDDLRLAWRSLAMRRNRPFTIAMLLTFALGIGAATAIFSIVHAVLIAPLPYRDAAEVVRLSERNLSRGLPEFAVSTPNFLSWQERSTSFESIAALRSENVNLGADDRFERVRGLKASSSIWSVLGMPLVAGRPFTTAEDQVGAAPVAMIGEGLWRSRFAADPALLGRTISVNGQMHTVVGIAPLDVGFATDIGIWLPLALDPQTEGRGDRRLQVLGRLAPGVNLAQARAELLSLSQTLASEFVEDNAGWEAAVQPVRDWIVGEAARSRLLMLLGAVVLLMLVACTNVANLQIARAATRQRELGVRQVLGAARARLLTQLIAENALLAVLGGALGVVLAYLVLNLAISVLPAATPRLAVFALDWRAALLAFVVTAGTAIGFGLAPMLLAMRTQLASVLHQLGRSSVDARRGALRQVLVVVQFALATVLVVASALLAQHLSRLQDTSLGFRPEHLLVARLSQPQENEDVDLTPHLAIYERLLEQIGSLPGVESVGITSEIPLGDFNTSMMVARSAGGALTYEQDSVQASWRVISSEYLATLGVPLLRGRGFYRDNESSRSMLLSEGLARRLFADGTDPVGQTVRLSNGQARQVIGVVADVRQIGLGEDHTPTMYMPTSWIVTPTMTLLVRSDDDPSRLIAPIRALAQQISPDHPLFDLRSMGDVISSSVAEPRVQTLVLLAFASASLLLAAFGVAGVMAYLVATRAPELAVRMALGATSRRLVAQVLRNGGALCLAGIVCGSALLLALHGLWPDAALSAHVPSMLGSGAALLLAVGMLACWLPARRVARISPNLAMREH